MARFAFKPVSELFEVRSGNYHVAADLDAGDVPLVSCGEIDNGVVGFFDIPQSNTYERALTVAYNGAPLMAKFHPYRFGAKDDVAVLIPKNPLPEIALLYITSVFSQLRWRYHYGRKCFKAKLQKLPIRIPVTETGEIDVSYIEKTFSALWDELTPESSSKNVLVPIDEWKDFEIISLFETIRGDFHSITDLASGSYPTVSRSSADNGIVGFFEKPEGAKVYSKPVITVSTVGGDAFVQVKPFIVTDNVIVCVPRTEMPLEVLFFVTAMLNRQRWRYGYGRQCYKKKFDHVVLPLPVAQGKLDQKTMTKAVKNTTYWNSISSTVP